MEHYKKQILVSLHLQNYPINTDALNLIATDIENLTYEKFATAICHYKPIPA